MNGLRAQRRIRTGGIATLLALLFAPLSPVACSRPAEHGPVPVQWDRANCERCAMAIGDRRFAAEVRGAADRRVHFFDDLGCALLWLDEHPAQDGSATEIWVRGALGEHWVDARTARYSDGHRTPMGYGLAVTGSGEEPEAIAFEHMRAIVGQKEHARCRP